MNTRATGIEGETIACEHLKKLGYVILARNFADKTGEIDIIARDREYYVFVEVKSRNSYSFGSPLESVTPDKIYKIVRTSEHFLLSKGAYNADCRYDIIIIKGELVSEHIKNAFTRADGGRKKHW